MRIYATLALLALLLACCAQPVPKASVTVTPTASPEPSVYEW